MNVRMPDGTIVKNVPEGTTQTELQRRYGQYRAELAVSESKRKRLSGESQPEYRPTDDMDQVQRFLAGVGKSAYDTGRGLKQIGAEAGNALGLVDDSTVSGITEDVKAARARDQDLLSTGAGLLGNVAGTVGSVALPLGAVSKAGQAANFLRTAKVAKSLAVPTGYGSAAGSGALLGAVQPVASDESRLLNAAVGGGVGIGGQFAANLIGRVAQPIRAKLNSAEKRAVENLEAAGVELSPAQRTGSRVAQSVERRLADNPASAPSIAAATAERMRSFTRAALRTIGEEADEASPAVLGAARQRIGNVFDEVYDKNTLKITDSVKNQINEIKESANRLSADPRRILAQIKIIEDKTAGGALPGSVAKQVRSDLADLARDPDLVKPASALRELLEDVLQKSTSGTDDFARLQQARMQYRNLGVLAESAGTDEAAQVSSRVLAQRLKSGKYTKNSWRYGRGDTELSSLARSMNQVLDKFPNSGTASRAAAQHFGTAGIGGVAGALYGQDIESAAKGAALGYAIPRTASWVVNSPAISNYLVRGISGFPRNALTLPQNIGLGRVAVPLALNSE